MRSHSGRWISWWWRRYPNDDAEYPCAWVLQLRIGKIALDTRWWRSDA